MLRFLRNLYPENRNELRKYRAEVCEKRYKTCAPPGLKKSN